MKLISIEVLASSAFAAGVIAFFSPCSYPMLPAYISYFLGKGVKDQKKPAVKSALEGVKFGGAATLGFFSVFIVMGALVSLVGEVVRPIYPWVLVVIGNILIALGASWVAGSPLYLRMAPRSHLIVANLSFYFFGVIYAFAAIACVLPVFLMIVFSALAAGGFLLGLLIFLIYALGMGVMMVVVSVAVALSKELLLRRFRSVMPYVHKVSAVILILAGIYLLFYWYMTFVAV